MAHNIDRDARFVKVIEPDAIVDKVHKLVRHRDGTEENIPDFDVNPEWFQRLMSYLKRNGQLLSIAERVLQDENEALIAAGDADREKKLYAQLEAEAAEYQTFITQAANYVL